MPQTNCLRIDLRQTSVNRPRRVLSLYFWISAIEWRLIVLWVCCWNAAAWTDAQQSARNHSLANREGNGYRKAVADVLETGDKPGTTDRGCAAAGNGRLKLMKSPIHHGTDVNAQDTDCQTVRVAAINSEAQAVTTVIEDSPKPDGPSLGQASWLGELESVRRLLDAGVNPDAGIVQAAQGGHVEIVGLLLDKGANINVKSEGGHTALHTGALQGGIRTVQLLLKKGAEPNATDEQGKTPLHSSIMGDCQLETIKLLVRSGAKVDTPDDEGVTPVRLAAIRGSKPVYDWLVATSGGKEPGPRFDGQRPLRAQSTKELLTALSSNKPNDRNAAQRELVARGKEIMPDALRSVESGGSVGQLCELFIAMGPAAEAALPKLESLLADKTQVFLAAFTMEQMKPDSFATLPIESRKKAAASLYEAIIDPKLGELAGYHLDLLNRTGDVSTSYVLKLLRSGNPRTRLLAVKYMTPTRSSNEEIVAELLRVFRDDRDSSVRLRAADALITIGKAPDEVRAGLLSVMKNPPRFDPTVPDDEQEKQINSWRHSAQQAASSLAKFGPCVIDDLIPLLSPLDARQRSPAITALVQMGAPAIPRLIELLAHDDRSVAISASVALNRIGNPAVPALAKTISTGSEQVIEHATNALWWIAPGGKAALPSLLEFVGSKKHSDASRVAAARAAMKIDASVSRQSRPILSAIPVLIRVLESGSFKHQAWAAETLGGIGPAARDALPMLRKRLELSNKDVDTGGLVRDYVQREAKAAISAIEVGTTKTE